MKKIKLLIASLALLLSSQANAQTPCPVQADPTFNLSIGNSGLTGSSTTTGTHTWEVYEVLGLNGPYQHLGNFSGNSFTAYPGIDCYYVIHRVIRECSNACRAMQICNEDCYEFDQCTYVPATNLQYDPVTGLFTWDAVPFANYYEIEFTPNACCHDPDEPMPMPNVTSAITPTNSYTMDWNLHFGNEIVNCFGWRIITYCANGAITSSQTICEGGMPGEGRFRNPAGDDFNTQIESEDTKVSVFPNPAADKVDIEVVVGEDIGFKMSLFDYTGKQLLPQENQRTSNGRALISVDIRDIAAGIYMVKIITDDQKAIIRKLVIE